MINRTIEDHIRQRLFSRKAIIVLGPRQSGKTTILKRLEQAHQNDALYFNCDETDIRAQLSNQNLSILKSLIGENKLILIDEAQRVDNIGLTIKIMVDNLPMVQIVASGSSAFELSDRVNEPLTGRKWEFHLYPFSFEELAKHSDTMEEIKHLLPRLIYGSYPEIVNNPGKERDVLTNLSSSYLYKDIFSLYDIRKPELIEQLLMALSLQICSEVSYHELAQLLSSDPATIERYILILERAYIVFRLINYSTNQRNEIKKSRKIYFIDNGIRNALISDFRQIDLRDDIGKLWENYIVSELHKFRSNYNSIAKPYFWRSVGSGEIDFLELENAQLTAYEIKWNSQKRARTRSFNNLYPNAKVNLINRENYFTYLVGQ
ncbi:MAG: ATP-binding protein [Candidatus Cloacimonadaceae bacterium]|nr:ATP-binding protein [Candidatus Cloacimonadaceae bacterium]